MDRQTTKAYDAPFRAIWLPKHDVVDLRITVSGRPQASTVRRMRITAHLEPDSSRLLGISIDDNKTMRLGRWLRENWNEVDVAPDDPVPSGLVVYVEGANYAYFSLWPNLRGVETETVERRAEVHLDEHNELMRIRIPVTLRRREDGLAVAAGYLPTR